MHQDPRVLARSHLVKTRTYIAVDEATPCKASTLVAAKGKASARRATSTSKACSKVWGRARVWTTAHTHIAAPNVPQLLEARRGALH